MQSIASSNSLYNMSQEIQSHNSYMQFIKHLARDKQMPTFTHVKVTQMQRKHTLESTHINICNNKTHIVDLANQPSNTH